MLELPALFQANNKRNNTGTKVIGEIQNPSFNVLIIDLTPLKSEEIFGAPNKI